MPPIIVDTAKCARDGACIAVCPATRLRAGSDGLPEIVPGKEAGCIRCGHCVAVCPHAAFTAGKIRPQNCPDVESLAPLPAWENVERLMKTRRSIRRYSDRVVPQETLDRLLDTARWAPSACNGQPVRWIVVSGPDKVREMASMVIDWSRAKNVMPEIQELWERGEDWPLRGAPHVVMACGPKGFGPADCVIAATTLELAAAALGIGACWAGFFAGAANDHPPLRELLDLAEGNSVHAALMLGYAEHAYHRVPPRKPAEIKWI